VGVYQSEAPESGLRKRLAFSSDFNPATKRARVDFFAPTPATKSSPFSRINFTSMLEASVLPCALVSMSALRVWLLAFDFTVRLDFLD